MASISPDVSILQAAMSGDNLDQKMLSLFLSNEHFRTNLLQKTEGHFNVNKNVYKDFIKALFTPKSVDFHSTTYEAT
jgi:methyltransferase-like protein